MVARGRLSEMAGAFALDIDHALRILDFGRAAPAVEAAWPPETRDFVGAFLAGLNHATLHGRAPPEFGLLGLSPEPYTAADMLAIGRLGGHRHQLAGLLLPARRARPAGLRAAVAAHAGGRGGPGANRASEADPRRAALGAILAGLSRSGSNAVAVAPVAQRVAARRCWPRTRTSACPCRTCG